MPVGQVKRKWRGFERHFGIAAPRVVVRTHWPRGWLMAASVVAFAMALLASFFGYRLFGARSDGEELQRVRDLLFVRQKELDRLRSTDGTGKNAVNIERAAQQQLLVQLGQLERENAQLKEDLLLFERLVPVAADEGQIRVEGFRLQSDGVGRYRYRVLLAYQGGKQAPDFKGRFQLQLIYVSAGRQQQILLPGKASGVGEYQLDVRHFLRREGVFQLPEAAELQSAEVQVLQGDTLKARKQAQF